MDELGVSYRHDKERQNDNPQDCFLPRFKYSRCCNENNSDGMKPRKPPNLCNPATIKIHKVSGEIKKGNRLAWQSIQRTQVNTTKTCTVPNFRWYLPRQGIQG